MNGRWYDMRARHTLYPKGCPNLFYHMSAESRLRCNISSMMALGKNTFDLEFSCGHVFTVRFTTSYYKTICYRRPSVPIWDSVWDNSAPGRFLYSAYDAGLTVTAIQFLDEGNMTWCDAGVGREFM